MRALALALTVLLAASAGARAAARPLLICERQAKGDYGMISAAAVVAAETEKPTLVYANWYVDGLDSDSRVGLTVSFFSPAQGDPWAIERRNVFVSYEGPRPAQSIWASITLDDGDSRLARATGIGPEYSDDGDRYAHFEPGFMTKFMGQGHVTVEVAAADGSRLGLREVDVRAEAAEAALTDLVTGLRDDVAHYEQRCRKL